LAVPDCRLKPDGIHCPAVSGPLDIAPGPRQRRHVDPASGAMCGPPPLEPSDRTR
jgi:hypothetical protein